MSRYPTWPGETTKRDPGGWANRNWIEVEGHPNQSSNPLCPVCPTSPPTNSPLEKPGARRKRFKHEWNQFFFFVMEKNCYALSVKKKISRSGRASAVHFAQKECSSSDYCCLVIPWKRFRENQLKKTAILQEINTNEKKKIKKRRGIAFKRTSGLPEAIVLLVLLARRHYQLNKKETNYIRPCSLRIIQIIIAWLLFSPLPFWFT